MISTSSRNDPILLLSLTCPLTFSEPSCVNLIAIDLDLLSLVKLEGIAICVKLRCQVEGTVLWTVSLEGVWMDSGRKLLEHFPLLVFSVFLSFEAPLGSPPPGLVLTYG